MRDGRWAEHNFRIQERGMNWGRKFGTYSGSNAELVQGHMRCLKIVK